MCGHCSPPHTQTHTDTLTLHFHLSFLSASTVTNVFFHQTWIHCQKWKQRRYNSNIIWMVPVENVSWLLPYFHMQEVNLEWSNNLYVVYKTTKIRQASVQRVGATKPFPRKSVSSSGQHALITAHTDSTVRTWHKQSECLNKNVN